MTAVADALEAIAREGGGQEVVDAMKRVLADDGLKPAGLYLIHHFEEQYKARKLDASTAGEFASRVTRCITYPHLFLAKDAPKEARASLSD